MSSTMPDAPADSAHVASSDSIAERVQPRHLSLSELPSLENGDRLTRAEFHRRYLARPDIKKAELIEGIVYIMSSPVSVRHGESHMRVNLWLCTYEAQTPGVKSTDNTTTVLDGDNEPQPDVALWIEECCGGQSHINQDDFIEGPPELIVEIAVSSASNDLHGKKQAYRRRGVREYIVWRVRDEALDWFVLEDDAYRLMTPDAQGVIESTVFPGLRLAVADLLADRKSQMLDELKRGLASEAHRAFVEKLKQAANR